MEVENNLDKVEADLFESLHGIKECVNTHKKSKSGTCEKTMT